MNRLLRLGTLLFCLGVSAPAFSQTYDDSDVSGNYGNCRAVVGQAEIDGTGQQVVGRACLQPDGTWQFVQSPDGNVMWYPVATYPYSDPWWWGPPLFISWGVSFIFVDNSHRFHRFNKFRQLDHNHFSVHIVTGFRRAPFQPGGFQPGGMHGVGGMQRNIGGMRGSGGESGGMRRR
ncbi:hypothetical protein [Paraburkholderia sp. BL10I2N1]|uniref:hypothetical protein n=1 Tax=Paraburkholderia sp. BL10I2N1 TaxID=1938796 RepID=UPI00105DF518|nr:hypothetical protein [Paraburkholderia sp. BL10I2N1]TDN61277.1 hypothetical protein B0G77_4720 [Paraburkholderia sp. BL10I2N1]